MIQTKRIEHTQLTEHKHYDIQRVSLYMNLMAGHWCPIIHRLNLKTHVDVKNGQLKAVKAALRHLVHALMFKVGFYFRSFPTTKSIIKKALIYLGHHYPAIRFICRSSLCNYKRSD